LAIFGCKRVNCDEMDGDRLRLPANRNCYRLSRVSWALLKLLVQKWDLSGYSTKHFNHAHMWNCVSIVVGISCWNYVLGELVLVLPDINTGKLAGHECKKSVRSLSLGRSSASCRSIIQCSVCSKTFNNSSALAKHKLIHSDDRRYTCSQCSKSFKRQDHL